MNRPTPYVKLLKQSNAALCQAAAAKSLMARAQYLLIAQDWESLAGMANSADACANCAALSICIGRPDIDK